ncbi:hypothetical protein PGQ11_000959 [Apiospora arundinis]
MFRFAPDFFLLCAALATLATLARGEGGWPSDCKLLAPITVPYLRADCGNPQGCTRLDLDQCYAWNPQDGIHAMDDGFFGTNCSSCEMEGDDISLWKCKCGDDLTHPTDYILDTNSLIRTEGGNVACFGHIGTPCDGGPPTAPRSLDSTAPLARRDSGDWSKSCSSASMSLGELQANCNTPPMGPPWICSELSLNHCFGWNTKDGIFAKDGGNFGEHCEGCELDDDHHTMRCQCQDGTNKSGKAESYYINTDTLIRNDAGYLACYGHVGTKCQGDKAAATQAVAFTA